MTASSAQPAVEWLSERLLLLRFGNAIDVDINAQVHAALRRLIQCDLSGVEEYIPAYTTLAVAFDPDAWFNADDSRTAGDRLAATLLEHLRDPAGAASVAPRTIEIPVCYDESLAPDLLETAARLGLSPIELASRHASGHYQVAMLGFAPGFPYLLGLDPTLHLPRRPQPRLRVPAGSVAVGGGQTGIYPDVLPGGWHLIGRTPWRLFDPHQSPPNRLAAGDAVRFVTIDLETFQRLDEHAK